MTVKDNQTQTGDAPSPEEALIIASEFEELERVRAVIRRFCRRAGSGPVPRDRICDIELAATEVLTNIIRHAYRGAGDRNIHIRMHLEGNALVLTVHDWGRPFDPNEVPPPDFDGSRTGGFGLYIVGQLVDEIEFSRDQNGRNRTRLKMDLGKQNTLE